MISNNLNSQNQKRIRQLILDIESSLSCDLLLIISPISEPLDQIVRRFLENMSGCSNGKPLYVILTTYGGAAEVAEKIVKILRHFYKEVYFIITEYAYSAGTIMSMSGDAIYMNYYSVLGPIDPQVKTHDGKYVSAMNYLDKLAELVKRDKENDLSRPEFWH